MFQHIIFDVDGTILDTEPAILNSLQQVLKEEGFHYEQQELTFALGIPGKETLKRIGIADVERVHKIWSAKMLDFSNEVTLFPGMRETIQAVHSQAASTGIVTSKTSKELGDEFTRFNVNEYFQEIVCADHTALHKPNPEPLLLCMEKLYVKPQQTLYIGDSIYDMQCAHAAGVKFALALWGAKKIDAFQAADYVLQEPKDLLQLVTK